MIVRPPHSFSENGKVVYLAGPLKSAPNWQKEACDYFERSASGLHIINPRWESLPLDFDAEDQFQWEYFHQCLALERGCVMFWFPANMKNRRPFAYGGKALIDLGEIVAQTRLNKGRIYIGMEPGWRSLAADYIKCVMGEHIYESLEELCRQVVKDSGFVWQGE